MGTWADERLKSILGSFKYEFMGGAGELRFVEIKSFKGESSINIRKGKKIVSYDYNARVKWDCEVKDGEGKIVGKISGEYEMPEISNDVDEDGEEW